MEDRIELEQDALIRLLSKKNQDELFTMYSRVYAWTNEQLGFLFDNFYDTGESALLVAGSGDQAINAALYGAKNIDVFDINQFALYYFDLKLAAMLTLDFPEFLDFMPILFNRKYPSENCLNWETYPNIARMLKDISQKSYLFWQKALYRKRYDYIIDLVDNFFIGQYNDQSGRTAMERANYLEANTYAEAKKKISRVNINRDRVSLNMVPDIYKKHYDMIYFSNIAQYATQAFPNPKNGYYQSLVLYKDFLEHMVKPMLNESGTAIINYCFYDEKDMPPKNRRAMKEVFEYNRRYTRLIVPNTDETECIIALKK